jgi:hypothetical protein
MCLSFVRKKRNLHRLRSHFRKSLALLRSVQLLSVNRILHHSMTTTTLRLSWAMMIRSNLSIKPSWMHLEDDPVNHRARLLATNNLGRDQLLLQHMSQRKRHVERTRYRRLENCSIGRHVNMVESHLIDLDTVLVKALMAPSSRCFQTYKPLKNGRMLPVMIRRVHPQVCILRHLVQLRHTPRQRVESLRIMVCPIGTEAGA